MPDTPIIRSLPALAIGNTAPVAENNRLTSPLTTARVESPAPL